MNVVNLESGVRYLARVAAALLLITVAGCRAPVATVHGSAEELGAVVLGALVERDRGALERLALDAREFRDHVWPSLPAARPERNLPVEYVWGDLDQKSRTALGQVLARHGGRRYELVGVAFDGVTDYGPFRVYRDASLQVRDGGGAMSIIRVCGSMFEQDGGWKVFSYNVTD